MSRSHHRLWRLGTALNDAWRLASDKSEIEQIQGSGALLREQISAEHPSIFAITELIANASDETLKMQDLLAQKRNEVLDDLFNSELFAFSRNSARQYALIPENFWEFAEADWFNNSAYDDDTSYTYIRVCTYEQAGHLAKKPKIGRPSLRPALLNILSELDPEFVRHSTHKEVHQAILEYANKNCPDQFAELNKADQSTIRKAVVHYRNSYLN
jgi:hypothetical protein